MKRIFRIITAVLSMGLFVVFSSGCGSNDNNSTSTQTLPFIGAELISFSAGSEPFGFTSGAAVTVKDPGGNNITDATVIMKGISLPYSAVDQQYVGDVIISPGETVTLSAIVGNGTYTVTGNQFTTYPVISAPTSSSVLPLNSTISVLWSGGTPTLNANGYGIGVLNANDPNAPLVWPGDGHLLPVLNTSATLPAGSLAAGSYLVLSCIAGNNVAIPNAAVASALLFLGCSYVPITVQ